MAARLKLVEPEARTLPVLTVYYRGRDVVRRNRAGNELRACGQALQYMRSNRYEATVAEVYNTDTGELYSVLKRNVEGRVTAVFEREYDEEAGV